MPKRPGTPPPVWQSSEDRDLAALERRNAERFESGEDEGSPEEPTFHEDTRPTVLAIQRYESDAAFRELWDRVSRIKGQDRQVMSGVANTVLPAINVVEDVAVIKKQMHTVDLIIKFGKWILGLAIAAVVANVAVFFSGIYSRGELEGEMRIRIQHLEQAVERLQDRLQTPRVPFTLAPSQSGSGPSQPKVTP